MAGLTLDSAALIAFERRDRCVMVHLKEAELRALDLTVSTVVIAEVWRGGLGARGEHPKLIAHATKLMLVRLPDPQEFADR